MTALRELARIVATTAAILIALWCIGALAGIVYLGFRSVAG